MISDHQRITDGSRLGTVDLLCSNLSSCMSPSITVVEQEVITCGSGVR